MYQNEWFANEFDTNEAYIITGIQVWIVRDLGSTLTLAIYGDGGEIPDVANELFSQQFSVTSTGAGWYGISGLSWTLLPGTYWVAFEVRSGDTFTGDMPFPAPNPLLNTSYYNGSEYAASFNDEHPFGLKIEANPAPKPATVPSLMLLLDD